MHEFICLNGSQRPDRLDRLDSKSDARHQEPPRVEYKHGQSRGALLNIQHGGQECGNRVNACGLVRRRKVRVTQAAVHATAVVRSDHARRWLYPNS